MMKKGKKHLDVYTRLRVFPRPIDPINSCLLGLRLVNVTIQSTENNYSQTR